MLTNYRPFGSLFRELEDDMAEMERRLDALLRNAVNLPDGETPQPIVYGWTLQMGPDGVPRVTQFGNTGQTPAQLQEGWREPFVTSVVDTENNQVRLTCELPGVDKDKIKVETLPNQVVIEAEGPERKYRKVLPSAVELNPDSADASYNNGILELTIKLAKPIRPKGKTVKVR